ncbi:ABC transporter substrate-binding protein [bacterium]|nr:ABC transporter substrate-binding protein [bacterium]
MRPGLNFIALFAIALLIGCGGASGPKVYTPDTELPPGAVSRLGQTTPSGITLGGLYRMNEAAEPRSLDPVRTGESTATALTTQLYDGLVNLDPNLNIVPGFAESYEISDDGLLYTFKIRHGVYFHDDECFPNSKGRIANAHDVKYSFQRLLDPSTQSTGAWVFVDNVVGAKDFRDKKVDDVEGFEVVDDYTFKIHLHTPFSAFLQRLAMPYCFIHPHEAVEKYGSDFFQHPVGTGPFKFVHWKPGQDILMVRHPNYWKKDKDGVSLPYVDGVRCTFIQDMKIEFIEFDSGNLDRLYYIHDDLFKSILTDDNQLRPAYSQYQLLTRDLLLLQYYGFNVTKEPFTDKRVRLAFNYAIDRDSIIKYVLNGRGTPATGIVPPSMPNYSSITTGFTYDLEKAKTLMAEAGYPNGEGLSEITLELNSGGTVNELIAEAIQNQLKQIGVTVRLQIVEWTQHLQKIDDGETAFFRLAWMGDYPDPENYLALMWGKNFTPKGTNYSRYLNPEFDRLFEEGMRLTDEKKRVELYQQAEKIAYEDAPILFLYFGKRYRLMQPFVRGYVYNAQERDILSDVWLDFSKEETE